MKLPNCPASRVKRMPFSVMCALQCAAISAIYLYYLYPEHCFFPNLVWSTLFIQPMRSIPYPINTLHLKLAKVQWILHMLHLNLCRVFIAAILHFTRISMYYSYISVCMCHISFCLHVLHFNLCSQFHEFRQIAIYQ